MRAGRRPAGQRKAIVVHSREQATAALCAAAETGAAVTLLSPPAAALSQGAAVFRAMVEAARAGFPGVDAEAVLDCADSPGAAMNALRHGITAVRLAASPDIVRKINDMTAPSDSVSEAGYTDVLDLLNADDALAACRKWLNPL